MTMNNDLYKEVEKFVIDSFGINNPNTIHLLRTAYWIKKLEPEADNALLVSAVSHDIERAEKKGPDTPNYKIKDVNEYLAYHQKRGAEIIGDFLNQKGAEPATVQKVRNLVTNHEIGGDEDQNSLLNADSLSWLENLVDHFLEHEIVDLGIERVRKKINRMYNRITSEKYKKIAEPYYKNATEKLAEICH